MDELIQKASLLKGVTGEMAAASTDDKNSALLLIASELEHCMIEILQENRKDVQLGKEKGFTSALIDRLTLTEDRIKEMANALRSLIELKDPIGITLEEIERPNGLVIKKKRVPIGVIGMIYEARPNVTVDAASLCLKTGNTVLFRGSSSAAYSNKALVKVIHQALEKSALPKDCIQLLEDTSRANAEKMFALNEYLDVLIPRGGASLIQTVVEKASIPVLETGVGNCHVFVDESADEEMATNIVINAKTQRPSVCNAAETLLVHRSWAKKYFNQLVDKLVENNVTLKGDVETSKYDSRIDIGEESDWTDEFLDLTLAVKVVDSIDDAITHIANYGTKHSEAIITQSNENVEKFFTFVDAAAVYHNASTRFTDGAEFGFGAEIGISTQKLHARGPMGLEAITSYKYVIYGTGQIKE
ncbi:glutamate-5-semialdehyde dehydrogenase [Evansella cellulosilytica]|uniref:Gamma-glutamyl phosphate reductase n=1 Tax=Evansella cellulosilytica (strain ATCC 21833 / DSM 2522 / FERM P-1141 / JCM 9156 / N-4) TaxID=649639 RepID=E6U0V5_EVAC2|nr:glutamate-5-semialdehyde dehydrogenase [Evansella cellulosilytica]ADU30267.1 gamma-glutamyl phosphate reductase [Evansella cellulosilytica DSM 2522]